MSPDDNRPSYLESLISLYHLVINADGVIDEKESRMGEIMRNHEGIEEWRFNYYLKKAKGLDRTELLQVIVNSLKKCDYNTKVKCIAWISIIANSDGFMAKEEWKLIFHVYDTCLKLNIKDILETQKKLPRPI